MQTVIKKFKKNLQEENLKSTPQRLAILEEMMKTDEHLECEEILLKLKEKGNKVSRATLYRTMDILVKYKFVRKLEIGDGRVRYDSNLVHGKRNHDHMICLDSGDIIEFYNDKIEKLQNEIAEKNGYKIIRRVHQLFVKKV